MFWFLFSLIVFLLPGFFLVKIIYPEKEKIPVSLFLSLPVFLSLAIIPISFFLVSLLKPFQLNLINTWAILLIINLALFLLGHIGSIRLKNPWPKIIFPGRKSSLFLAIIIFLSLLLLLAPYFRPHLGPFWSTYHFARGRDVHERIAVIVGLKKFGLPPQNPDLVNQPLNYYYFYHLDAAVLSVLSNEVISAELTHLLLSGAILISSVLLASHFFYSFTLLLLFLGYGFDFFPMIFSLLKIRPYINGLDHLDNWTAPFFKDLKVNPLSVWFAWVPHHALAIFLFLIFVGIFFDLIKIKKHLKQIILGVLLFSILGTSAYIFIGGSAVIFFYFVWQKFKPKPPQTYQFLLVALPFCLLLAVPMAIRINTPTLTIYPFWQLPRDHLFNYQFPQFPLPVKFILLVFCFFLRFLVYFFDLGIIFLLAVFSWKKVPKTPFFTFAKIMLLISTFTSVLIKSIPYNNDLSYRISGFSWLACAFLVNSQIEKFWLKIRKFPILLFFLVIIIFSPTMVEQIVFPRFEIGSDFWQMKNFVNKNIPQNAIVQTTPDFTPAGIYLLERKIIYSPYGWLFYPPKNQMEQARQDMITIFTGTAEDAMALIKKYQIDYILVQNAGEFKSAPAFEEVFDNQKYLIYRTGKFHF